MYRTTTGLHIWSLNIATRRLAARDQWVQASMCSRALPHWRGDLDGHARRLFGDGGDREGIIGAVGVVFSQSRGGVEEEKQSTSD